MGEDLTTVHVRRAIGGDRDSVAWLATHFHGLVRAQVELRLRGHGSAADVDDVAADVWVTTFQRLPGLVPREGRHTPVLVRFLGTTALWCCNNFLRQRARRGRREGPPEPAAEPGDIAELVARTRGVLSRVGDHELAALVERSLGALDAAERAVLVLRLLEQRTNQEIATLLGLLPNTVAVRYRRALERLRTLLPPEVWVEWRNARQPVAAEP